MTENDHPSDHLPVIILVIINDHPTFFGSIRSFSNLQNISLLLHIWFLWYMIYVLLMIYVLDIIKWYVTNLFSSESNIWYPSVTTSVQHFTKRSWTSKSFSFCRENFYVSWFIMLIVCRSGFCFYILITVTGSIRNHKKWFFSAVYLALFIT